MSEASRQFGTILTTCVCLLSGVLALLLWDLASRSSQIVLRLLAVAFAATWTLELVHLMVSVEWSGVLAPVSRLQDLRRATWPTATYVLPIGILGALSPLCRGNTGVPVLGLMLLVVSLGLLGVFYSLPGYSSPVWLGITRPSLSAVPVLWIIISWLSWRRRATDRLYPTLLLMAVAMTLAHVSMIYSRVSHDTGAMIAHLGEFGGYLMLLLSLMQMAAGDVRERMRAQHALVEAHARLYATLQQTHSCLEKTQRTVMEQERTRALEQMASGLANDINNALSPAMLYTESLLEREPGLSQQCRGHLTTIQRAIDDVAATTLRMKDLYRPRTSQVLVTQVDLNRLVKQVIDLTHARWSGALQGREAVVDVRAELAEELPVVPGTESEIRDALTNLIFNAIDAMPRGGWLTLRTRTLSRRENHDNPASAACIEVVDTGVGMDDETRHRCLEPFFTTKDKRGSGLGLATVYGVIQRHSGELEVESEPGKGTTVRLVFSTAAGTPVATEPRSPHHDPSGAREFCSLMTVHS